MKAVKAAVNGISTDLVGFVRKLVQTRSYTGEEERIIRVIEAQMKQLGYDEVLIDTMGNLLGRIGHGPKSMMLDAHVDTVAVTDASQWRHDPFGAVIEEGRLYGRGAVDMKSAAGAAVYAAAVAKQLGLHDNKTIYVSCTVMEEDCDGENLNHLFKALRLQPDYMIICEPSANRVATGHKGKAQVAIKTHGISAHGSAPEKGLNAIYEMAEIIQRIEATSRKLQDAGGKAGTLVASRIASASESLNAVPFACEIYLDRRMAIGETEETIRKEMDAIVEGKKAGWQLGVLQRKSWTGYEVTYTPFHLPWEIERDHELTRMCVTAYRETFGAEPEFDYWDFSTNAVATVARGIPTIGFGPGEHKLAHMVDEHCAVSQIIDACEFYADLIGKR